MIERALWRHFCSTEPCLRNESSALMWRTAAKKEMGGVEEVAEAWDADKARAATDAVAAEEVAVTMERGEEVIVMMVR